MVSQKTLKSSIRCAGVGLHAGVKVSMALHPAPVDSGIVFRRVDLVGEPEIPATWQYVRRKPLCTALGRDDAVTVATVEHLMAALWGAGVDNAVIDLDGPEVPVMDGSAAPFVFLIECAGIVDQPAPRRIVEVLKPVVVAGDARRAALSPGAGLSVEFEIEFDHPLVARQAFAFEEESASFKDDLSRARTFGFEQDVARLKAQGLARGGSLDNAVVVSRTGILNRDGLRYADEFVRHKVLDCIGDLYLAGARVHGRFHGVCSGHAMTAELLRALFSDDGAWRFGLEDQSRRGHGLGRPLGDDLIAARGAA